MIINKNDQANKQQDPTTKPNMKLLSQEENWETNKNDNMVIETDGEEMEIGDLYLEGLEVACSEKVQEKIPPQQVSLLEKAINKAKTMKFLGITSESLKDPNCKKKGKNKKEEGTTMCKESKSLGLNS